MAIAINSNLSGAAHSSQGSRVMIGATASATKCELFNLTDFNTTGGDPTTNEQQFLNARSALRRGSPGSKQLQINGAYVPSSQAHRIAANAYRDSSLVYVDIIVPESLIGSFDAAIGLTGAVTGTSGFLNAFDGRSVDIGDVIYEGEENTTPSGNETVYEITSVTPTNGETLTGMNVVESGTGEAPASAVASDTFRLVNPGFRIRFPARVTSFNNLSFANEGQVTATATFTSDGALPDPVIVPGLV